MPDAGHPDSCDLEIRVRYAEVDRMGVLHHSHYLVYFEMGRTELLRKTSISYRDLEDLGIYLVVVKASVTYSHPARYDDILLLTTRIKKVGQVKIQHTYELKRKSDGLLLARGETALGCVDCGGKIVALPEAIKKTGPRK